MFFKLRKSKKKKDLDIARVERLFDGKKVNKWEKAYNLKMTI